MSDIHIDQIKKIDKAFDKGRLEDALSKAMILCRHCIESFDIACEEEHVEIRNLYSQLNSLNNDFYEGKISYVEKHGISNNIRSNFSNKYLRFKEKFYDCFFAESGKNEYEIGEYHIKIVIESFVGNESNKNDILALIVELIQREIESEKFHLREKGVVYVSRTRSTETRLEIKSNSTSILKPNQSSIGQEFSNFNFPKRTGISGA